MIYNKKFIICWYNWLKCYHTNAMVFIKQYFVNIKGTVTSGIIFGIILSALPV